MSSVIHFFSMIRNKSIELLLSPAGGGFLGAMLAGIAYWIISVWFLGFFSFIIPLFIIHRQYPVQWIRAAQAGFSFGFFYVCVWAFPLLSFQPSFLNILAKDLFANIIVSIKFFTFLFLCALIMGIGSLTAFIIGISILRRSKLFFLFSFPFFWMLLETGFRYITFGFEWWSIGKIFTPSPLLRQWAAFGGVNVLSWLLITSNVLLFFIIHSSIRKQPFPRPVLIAGIIFFTVIFLFPYVFFYRTDNAFPFPVRIAVFQPGTIHFPRSTPLTATEEFSRSMDTFLHAKPDILIIPGQLKYDAVSLDDINDSLISSLLGSLAQDKNLISIVTLHLKEKNNIIHSALVALRQAKTIGIYRKEILMPVSDYKPPGFIQFVFPQQLYGNVSAFTGDNGLLLANPPVGGLICNEILVPRLAPDRKQAGAHLLILSGNDAAFTSEFVAQETLRVTQLRAVENRIWIIRAEKTGVSAVINPRGDIVTQLPRNQEGILVYP